MRIKILYTVLALIFSLLFALSYSNSEKWFPFFWDWLSEEIGYQYIYHLVITLIIMSPIIYNMYATLHPGKEDEEVHILTGIFILGVPLLATLIDALAASSMLYFITIGAYCIFTLYRLLDIKPKRAHN